MAHSAPLLYLNPGIKSKFSRLPEGHISSVTENKTRQQCCVKTISFLWKQKTVKPFDMFPHLDVRAVVSSQVNSEGEGLLMAHLLEQLHHPVVLCWFRRLNNRTHGRKRRHGPLYVTAGVISRGLDQTTAVLHMQHAELHFIVFICWERREDDQKSEQKEG